jgi:hypothetical protein
MRFALIARPVSNFAQFSPRQGPSIEAQIRLLDSGATVGARNLLPIARFVRSGGEFRETGG